MLVHGVTFLVEETFPSDFDSDAESEKTEYQKVLCDRTSKKVEITRSIRRVIFFRSPGPVSFTQMRVDDQASIVLPHLQKDIATFRQLVCGEGTSPIECLGFVCLYLDTIKGFDKGLIRQAYVPGAVICEPRQHFLQRYNRPPYPPIPHIEQEDTTITRMCIHSKTKFTINVMSEYNFDVTGSFFAQQQGSVSCCAHAAASVVIRNLSHSVGKGRSITSKAINSQIDSAYARLNWVSERDIPGHHGLRHEDISQIFTDKKICGFPLSSECDVISSDDIKSGDKKTVSRLRREIFQRAYHIIESGLPVVLLTQEWDPLKQEAKQEVAEKPSWKHAVVAIGHTCDSGLWPKTRTGALLRTGGSHCGEDYFYNPSHTWVEGIIIQDDIAGPYCIMPRYVLENTIVGLVAPRFHWAPAGAAQLAENLSHCLLDTKQSVSEPNTASTHSVYLEHVMYKFEDLTQLPWFAEFLTHLNDGKPCSGSNGMSTYVLRTVPYTAEKYVIFLQGNRKGSTNLVNDTRLTKDIVKHLGTKPFWMVEISTPGLFERENKRLGEVLVRGSIKGEDNSVVHESCLLARLPGVLTIFHNPFKWNDVRIPGSDVYDIARLGVGDIKDLQLTPLSE
jgi:hypothetical protein